MQLSQIFQRKHPLAQIQAQIVIHDVLETNSAGLGQALVYIRPLQKSLEITSVDVEYTEEEVCIRKYS